ncbi:dethiobiotin synthase [Bradyrhizobium sp. USDA 3650]
MTKLVAFLHREMAVRGERSPSNSQILPYIVGENRFEGETDSQLVARLRGLPADRIVPERYRLKIPASPHHSAEIDGIRIDPDSLIGPQAGERPLVIEGAGGLMVPLNRSPLYIDIFERWRLPVVLRARTLLGTINHSLLPIEALRKRQIDILGIALSGERNAETESAICDIARVRWLGRLPWISSLTADSLRSSSKTRSFPATSSHEAKQQVAHLASIRAACASQEMTKVVRSDGAYLHTADDHRIIDAVASWWGRHSRPLPSADRERDSRIGRQIEASHFRRLHA